MFAYTLDLRQRIGKCVQLGNVKTGWLPFGRAPKAAGLDGGLDK